MKRSQILLSAVASVLLIALFYVLLYQPKREEVAEIQAAIAQEQADQVRIQSEINRLQSVRMEAPEVEAQLAAGETIVPRDAALPSALRQLQLAADESGLVLQTVSTSRPSPLDGAPTEGLSRIDVSLQMIGGYFQIVDFLRRVEDPQITPRGLTWGGATVSRSTYPELNVTLSGAVYAIVVESPSLIDPGAPIEGDAPTDEDGGLQEGSEDDVTIDSDPDVLNEQDAS